MYGTLRHLPLPIIRIRGMRQYWLFRIVSDLFLLLMSGKMNDNFVEMEK